MTRMHSITAPALLALVALPLGAVTACGSPKPAEEPSPVASQTAEPPPAPPPAPPPPSLYERLGKGDALQGIVEELMGNVLADKRISKAFDRDKKDKDRGKQLQARMVGELCVVAGGGDECAYDGKSMKDAHKGMNITQAQWDAFMEDLAIAMKTRSVDDALAKELASKLEEQTKADIVTGAPAPAGKAK
jgi:hemoglobin